MTSLQSAPPRHRHAVPSLRIALLAADDEAGVPEIGRRLARHGHDVTVYGAGGEQAGLRTVTLPALRSRQPLGHVAHLLAGRRADVAVVFGAAHVPLMPLIRARGAAVAVQADTLRPEPDTAPRRRTRSTERLAVREADALIVSAQSLQDDYDDEFGIPTQLIGYGTTVLRHTPTDLLEPLGLVPGCFHLAAGGQRVDVVVEGYHRSDAHLPLVVAGGVVSGTATDGVRQLAATDGRIRLLGPVADPRLLDQLSAHAAASVHAGAAGAADPALLQSMGAATAILAWDARRNREVVGTGGSFFSSPAQLARQIEEVERYPFRFRDLGELMQERARTRHDWDVVAEQYEALAARLARGASTRGMRTGRPIDRTWSSVATEVVARRG